MKKWNVENTKAVAAATIQQWTCVVDGITFISFVSYEDLMDKIREYRESK